MVQYYVTKVEECTNCNEGLVRHHMWEKFYEEFGDEWPDEKEEESWWNKHYFQVYYPSINKLPPEVMYCVECEGKVYIESRVPLEEALRHIGEMGRKT